MNLWTCSNIFLFFIIVLVVIVVVLDLNVWRKLHHFAREEKTWWSLGSLRRIKIGHNFSYLSSFFYDFFRLKKISKIFNSSKLMINRILLHNNYFHIELFKLFFSFQRIPKFNFGIIKFLLKKIKNLTTLLVVQVIFCPIRLNCFEISGQGWLNFPYIYTHTHVCCLRAICLISSPAESRLSR